jgi:hypothetical protein
MDEAAVAQVAQVAEVRQPARVWWSRFPPSVDAAVIEHGRAVAWLAAAAVAAAGFLLYVHEGVFQCAHRTVGTCGQPLHWIDGVTHAAGWIAAGTAVALLMLVYARLRHLMRLWNQAVPFAPRRRLLELAVEEGTLPRAEYDRLVTAFEETLSGGTFAERLRIRADVLTAFGWLTAGAGALAVGLVVLSLATAGTESLLPLTLLTLAVSAVGAVTLWAGRRMASTAFDASKWERHTARVLLERALKKLSVDPPR